MIDIAVNIPFFEQANLLLTLPSPLQKLEDNLFSERAINVFVKRDDLIHSEISGNKWRKLKYNLIDAQSRGIQKIITFGGAFSNHIYATAAAGKYFGFETVGIIRGEELNKNTSEILKFASACGMDLQFITRTQYREIRNNLDFFQTEKDSTSTKIIPEGGTTPMALVGIGEMLEEIIEQLGSMPDYIFCPVGTAGTISGILANTGSRVRVIGICVLKNGRYLLNEIVNLLKTHTGESNRNFEILWNEHHGGYAKKTPELSDFISKFNTEHAFEIEPVYSGKMFFAFYQYFSTIVKPGSSVVLIHTGGLTNAISI